MDTAATIAQLVNLGSAGAVIIVVIIFLKTIKERDAEWRDFFTALNKATAEDGERRMQLTEKILQMVEAVLRELHDHDAKVDERIAAAARSTTEAVTRAVNGKPQPRPKP